MEKFWLSVGLTIGRVAMYGVFAMLLINWLAPLFGFSINLGYFQSCGLTLLCWMLFKKEDFLAI